ncbi:MAG: hypothetical protein FWE21_03490 [Defluviitaleaceae bacterium]|nr:hypothetical protein [Defluviitaleaceae bacterium]
MKNMSVKDFLNKCREVDFYAACPNKEAGLATLKSKAETQVPHNPILSGNGVIYHEREQKTKRSFAGVAFAVIGTAAIGLASFFAIPVILENLGGTVAPYPATPTGNASVPYEEYEEHQETVLTYLSIFSNLSEALDSFIMPDVPLPAYIPEGFEFDHAIFNTLPEYNNSINIFYHSEDSQLMIGVSVVPNSVSWTLGTTNFTGRAHISLEIWEPSGHGAVEVIMGIGDYHLDYASITPTTTHAHSTPQDWAQIQTLARIAESISPEGNALAREQQPQVAFGGIYVRHDNPWSATFFGSVNHSEERLENGFTASADFINIGRRNRTYELTANQLSSIAVVNTAEEGIVTLIISQDGVIDGTEIVMVLPNDGGVAFPYTSNLSPGSIRFTLQYEGVTNVHTKVTWDYVRSATSSNLHTILPTLSNPENAERFMLEDIWAFFPPWSAGELVHGLVSQEHLNHLLAHPQRQRHAAEIALRMSRYLRTEVTPENIGQHLDGLMFSWLEFVSEQQFQIVLDYLGASDNMFFDGLVFAYFLQAPPQPNILQLDESHPHHILREMHRSLEYLITLR